MKQEQFTQLLLKGAFSMMACDGEIHETEIEEIKQLAEHSPYFFGLDYQAELKSATEDFKSHGIKAIEKFISNIAVTDLSEKQELTLIEVLIKVIVADNESKPSELKFLQMVKANLKVSEETLITKFPTHINHLIDLGHFGANISFQYNLEAVDFKALDKLDQSND